MLRSDDKNDPPKRLLIAHAERLMSEEAFVSIKSLTCMQFLTLVKWDSHAHPRLLSRSLSKEMKLNNDSSHNEMKYSQNKNMKPNLTHKEALHLIVEAIRSNGWLNLISAVGHR